MDETEKKPTLIDRVSDLSISDSEIFHDVVAGLDDRSQNHEVLVQALTNHRPCLLRQILCFAGD